jgi:hypothetical protein
MFACCMCHINTGVRLSTIVLLTGPAAAAASALLLMMGASRSSTRCEMDGNRMLAHAFSISKVTEINNKERAT